MSINKKVSGPWSTKKKSRTLHKSGIFGANLYIFFFLASRQRKIRSCEIHVCKPGKLAFPRRGMRVLAKMRVSAIFIVGHS